jgi:hypothetical protein
MRYACVSPLAGWVVALLLCPSIVAQAAHSKSFTGESVFARVNRQALQSRSGDKVARTAVIHQMFINAGIPTEVADAFGYTDRIATAEADFQQGSRPGIREAAVVVAVNNMVDGIGAPQWAHTNGAEVRKLHMHLLVLYPQLFAKEAPPDAKGRYSPLHEEMRPTEASWLAVTLLFQKAVNSEYQFTDAEQAQNAHLDSSAVEAMHRERTQSISDLVSGRNLTMSVRDLLQDSERLFEDLGISATAYASKTGAPSNRTKGGR